ncbi:hypothetical protein [Paraburkholderia sp. RL17-373-BIF-A]|uniref:hypothetical protein n=1 Tax=Paraburkholderia sp. RL17-373-BIF-A TaxID=3031629 RepID=UPI0038BDDDD6
MSVVTSATIKRAFVGDDYAASIPKSNVVMDGAKYGNAGGFGDFLLSILTFGIYAFSKSNKMDQKRAVVEAAVRELHQQIKDNPDVNLISVNVDGKTLTISEFRLTGNTNLKITLDGESVGIIRNTNLASFKKHLETEITPVPKLNDHDMSESDAHVYV